MFFSDKAVLAEMANLKKEIKVLQLCEVSNGSEFNEARVFLTDIHTMCVVIDDKLDKIIEALGMVEEEEAIKVCKKKVIPRCC